MGRKHSPFAHRRIGVVPFIPAVLDDALFTGQLSEAISVWSHSLVHSADEGTEIPSDTALFVADRLGNFKTPSCTGALYRPTCTRHFGAWAVLVRQPADAKHPVPLSATQEFVLQEKNA